MRLSGDSSTRSTNQRTRGRRVLATLGALVGAISLVPLASAHGGGTHVYVGGTHVTQAHALVPLAIGIAIVVASVFLPRVLRPEYAHYRLYGVFVGLGTSVLGAIGLVQLSPIEWYTTDPVIPRAIHGSLMLSIGVAIAAASLLIGRYRWPARPRYAGLGMIFGAWVAYPGLLEGFGVDALTHPLGYLLVLVLPVALGYILWRDARDLFTRLVENRQARWFGLGVGAITTVFFLFSSGMLTIVPDEGTGISLADPIVVTMPVADPLVTWPAIEFWFPRVPLGGMFSVGTVLLMGVLGGLVALNAGLIALQWQRGSNTGRSQTTAGVAGVAAPQACCCCGPLLSQIAIVVVGPSAAAPVYLLFADPSSSIGSLFLVASIAVLTGTLVRAASTSACRRDPEADAGPDTTDRTRVSNPSRSSRSS